MIKNVSFIVVFLCLLLSNSTFSQGCEEDGGKISLTDGSLTLSQTVSACGTLDAVLYNNDLPSGGPYEYVYVYWFESAGVVSPTVMVPGTGPSHTLSFTEAEMDGHERIGIRRCLRLVGTNCIMAETRPLTIYLDNCCPLTNFNISGANSVDVNSTSTYSVSPIDPAATYSWSVDGVTVGTGSTQSITFANSGTTSIIVTASGSGCSLTSNMSVEVTCLPGAGVSAPGFDACEITVDQMITLNAFGGSSYNWTFSSGLSPSSTTGSSVTVTVPSGAGSRFARVDVTSGGQTCAKSVSLSTRDCSPPSPPTPSPCSSLGITLYTQLFGNGTFSADCYGAITNYKIADGPGDMIWNSANITYYSGSSGSTGFHFDNVLPYITYDGIGSWYLNYTPDLFGTSFVQLDLITDVQDITGACHVIESSNSGGLWYTVKNVEYTFQYPPCGNYPGLIQVDQIVVDNCPVASHTFLFKDASEVLIGETTIEYDPTTTTDIEIPAGTRYVDHYSTGVPGDIITNSNFSYGSMSDLYTGMTWGNRPNSGGIPPGRRLDMGTLPAFPDIEFEIAPALVCAGESFTVMAPAGFDSYTWEPASQPAGATLTPSPGTLMGAGPHTLTPSIAGLYQIQLDAFNIGGCVAKERVQVEAINCNCTFPDPTIMVVTGCNPIASLTNLASMPSTALYSWYFYNDVTGALEASFQGEGPHPLGALMENTAYTVQVVVTDNGCTNTSTVGFTTSTLGYAGADFDICASSATITDFSPAGGTWSADAGNPSPATITNAGVITGMDLSGAYTFTYSVNGCSDDIVITNTSPTAPTGTEGERCGPGTVTLSASGCTGGTINWYTVSTGGTSVGMGTSYTTPSINSNTTYYVDCTIDGCTSSRTSVLATINPIPTIVANGSCDAGNATYSIIVTTTDANMVSSTSGNVTGSSPTFTVSGITVGTDVTLTAENSTTSCSVMETVTSPNCVCPAGSPGVTGAERCGSGDVTLMASSGANCDELRWYTAATGGSSVNTGTSYTVSLTGTTSYFVSCYNTIQDCESDPRVEVVGTVNSLPTISGSGLCDVGNTTYSITVTTTDADGLMSSTGSVTGSAPTYMVSGIAVGTDVVLTATNSTTTCSSMETVLSPNCACPATEPTGTGAERCGTGDVTLMASSGSNCDEIRWYTASTGGTAVNTGVSFTVNLTTTTSYFVSCYNTAGDCESSRIEVIGTVNAVPTIVANAACDSGNTTYSITVTTTEADGLTSTLGSVTGTAPNFTVSGINVGTDVALTATNSTTTCNVMEAVTSPNCTAPCLLLGITAEATNCVPGANTYTIEGNVSFENAPSTGTLTVSAGAGFEAVINMPATSPQSYSIAGLPADGQSDFVSPTFSDDSNCGLSLAVVDAPNGCPEACFSYVAAEPSPCDPATGLYNIEGFIYTTNGTNSGTITITLDGQSQVINLPLFQSYNFTFNDQPSDGLSHDISLAYSDDSDCDRTISFTAPTACDMDDCDLVINSVTPQEETCGDGTGTATVNTTYTGGGVLDYVWDPVVTENANMATGLSAGTYNVTATDGTLSTVSLCNSNVAIIIPEVSAYGNFDQLLDVDFNIPYPAYDDVGYIEYSLENHYGGDWMVSFDGDDLTISFTEAQNVPTSSSYEVCGSYRNFETICDFQAITVAQTCTDTEIGCFDTSSVTIIDNTDNCNPCPDITCYPTTIIKD